MVRPIALARRLVADQKVRFLAVGGVNTAVGYGTFALFSIYLLAEVRYGYLVSLVASYAIAISLAFVLYRRFVFHVTGRVVRDFLAFVGVYALAIGLNLALLPALVEIASLAPLPAQAIVLVCTTLISYFGHREVSFRRPEGPPTDPPERP